MDKTNESKHRCMADQQITQGDVFIRPINRIPEHCRKMDHLTLALGEATGHHHTITELPPGMLAEMYQDADGTLFLHIEGDDTVGLTHQEHDKVTIPAGDFEVGIQQEYDPFEDEAHRVAD